MIQVTIIINNGLRFVVRLPTIVETKHDRSLEYVASGTYQLSPVELKMRSRHAADSSLIDVEEDNDSDVEQDVREDPDVFMDSDYAEIDRAILLEDQQRLPVIVDADLDESMETNEELEDDFLLPRVVLGDGEMMEEDHRDDAVIVAAEKSSENVRARSCGLHYSEQVTEVSYSQVAKKMKEDAGKEVHIKEADCLHHGVRSPNLANFSSSSALPLSPIDSPKGVTSKLTLVKLVSSARRNLNYQLSEASDGCVGDYETRYKSYDRSPLVLNLSDVLVGAGLQPSNSRNPKKKQQRNRLNNIISR